MLVFVFCVGRDDDVGCGAAHGLLWEKEGDAEGVLSDEMTSSRLADTTPPPFILIFST